MKIAISQISEREFIGLSTDAKPTTNIISGSKLYELDTKNEQVFDGNIWDSYPSSPVLVDPYGVKCSMLGMVADNDNNTVATNNYTKLANALAEGLSVIVDGTYHLRLTNKTNLNKNVAIVGNSKDSKFIFQKGSIYFRLNNQSRVHIHGVTFINDGAWVRLFECPAPFFIDILSVSHCSFIGRVSLIGAVLYLGFNPANEKNGFSYFYFTDNIVSNTRDVFIYLPNCAHELFYVARNTITNFDSIFFNLEVSNHSIDQDAIAGVKKNLIVEHNVVKCDPDWWGNKNSDTGTYYCFVFFEGERALYHHNHVEGIKQEAYLPLYDAYLSATVVEYYNNVWINNVCFDPAKSEGALMKAKMYANDARYSAKRYYKNNVFIIEKSFCESLGKDPYLSWVQLYQIQSKMDCWVIENNTIDVCALRLPASSNTCKNIMITNNVIKSNRLSTAKTGSNAVLLYYRLENGVDYTDTLCAIKDNIIKITTQDESAPVFRLISIVDNTNGTEYIGDVIIDNNNVYGPLHYVTYGLQCKKFRLSNNIFHASYNNIMGVTYLGDILNYYSYNNFFQSKKKIYNPRLLYGATESNQQFTKSTISTMTSPPYEFRLSLKGYDPSAVKTLIIQELKLQMFDGFRHCRIQFEYGYDTAEDRNYIKFINEKALETTVFLNRNKNEDSYTIGNATFLKTEYLSNLNTGLRFKITNAPGNTEATGVNVVSTLTPGKPILCDVNIRSMFI